MEAIRAVQAATDPDAKLAAIDNVLTSFTDTEYKPLLLDMAVEAAEQKGDLALVQVWAERDLQSNPHSYVAMLAEANSVAASTKEFDLDKDQKLATAEKNAKGAIEELKTAQKPMPGIPDAQWEASKKQSQAQAYQILGIIETKRKNWDAAVADYKKAMEVAPNPNIEVRMGDAYEKEGKYDEAIAELDKALAEPNLDARTKNIATSLKNVAVKMKAAGIKPAAPASDSATTPQPAEVKK
ncbi:MAG TPA: tetratricopeptide repeat protein [Bryobacteraceae bacterium]|nr:tetratricopeptide repeat protein [Bryobacteraceae bacterium]